MKKLAEEFKKFVAKGNVIDLAVGVIIGGAFGKIVSSLVNDIVMPLIGLILGGYDFRSFSLQIRDVTIAYGLFIQNIIDFFIIALFVFIFIKGFNTLTKPEEKTDKKVKQEESASKQQIKLLTEIRDSLSNKDKND